MTGWLGARWRLLLGLALGSGLQTAVLLLSPGDVVYAGVLALLPVTLGLAGDVWGHRRRKREMAGLLAELETLRADLRQARQAAREKDDDQAALIHEAKTPLSVLKLALNRHEGPLPRAWHDELARLEQILETGLFASRASSFASDFLLQETELRALCAQVVARFAPAFLDRRLRFVLAEGNARVLTDPKWLAFVLSQLLSNALKYVPEGGEVRVSFTSRLEVTLAVEDNGPGLAPEDLPRLFDRGYTGHSRRAVQATGLGLYLAARLCAKLGHRLSAHNRPEGGARFVVEFPPAGTYLSKM